MLKSPFKNRTSVSLVATTLLVLALGYLTTAIANARTKVPIASIDFAGGDNVRRWRTATLIVPDRDTTRPAYGRCTMRRYDVHIAKTIEVTAFEYCQENSDWNGVEWRYLTDDGNINMGTLELSCELTRKVVAQFGLGAPERTLISHRGGEPREVNVPVLSLNFDTRNKVPELIRFVDELQPKK